MMEIKHNQCGFAYVEFVDRYNNKCSLESGFMKIIKWKPFKKYKLTLTYDGKPIKEVKFIGLVSKKISIGVLLKVRDL
jgi:hypothetical protein